MAARGETSWDPYAALATALRDAFEDALARAFERFNPGGDVPLLVDIPTGAQRLGIGQTKVKELISNGQLGHVKCGRRTLIPVSALDAFASNGRSALKRLQGGGS
jgi:excisionase family DNA binding protein